MDVEKRFSDVQLAGFLPELVAALPFKALFLKALFRRNGFSDASRSHDGGAISLASVGQQSPYPVPPAHVIRLACTLNVDRLWPEFVRNAPGKVAATPRG